MFSVNWYIRVMKLICDFLGKPQMGERKFVNPSENRRSKVFS
jgi:hypothetical protein